MKGRKNKRRYVMGLDVGTTKICAIIGEEDADGTVIIRGVGTTPSLGLKKGIVVDNEQTVATVNKAVEKACRMAGPELNEVVVGIANGLIQCHNSRASTEIVNPERGVTRSDIRRVNERARVLSMPVDREILHSIPQEYVTDSGPVENPLGQVTSKLEVNVHIVTASVTPVQNLIRCVKQGGYNASDILLQPIASAASILKPEEKELGVLLLDIGGGTSDMAIFADGHIRYSGVITYGGDYLTRDIARCLKVSPYDAENIKKKYGCAMASLVRPEETFSITQLVNQKKETIRRQQLADIIELRVEEIFHLVRERIKTASIRDKNFSGVVITGGTALLEGIADLSEKVFDCPSRIGVSHGLKGMTSVISSPIYSTGVGLVLHGFTDALNQPPNGRGLYEWVVEGLTRFLRFFR